MPELENLNQKISQIEDNVVVLWAIVYRSEKLQTILVSQLESYSRQIPLNIIDCGPVEEEERSLGLAVQKLDAITKNLVILVELSDNQNINLLLEAAKQWEEEKTASYQKQIARFIGQWQKKSKDQTEPEIFEDVGDLNSEACPLDLVPLQDLLTDYCQEVCDRERAINILKKSLGEKDEAIQKLIETQQEKDEENNHLRKKVREEKASFKVQKEQLNNLTSVYKQSRQSFEDKLRNLKFELTTTKKKLNEAEERIRKLQDDLSDAQNASFLRATSQIDDPNDIARKFLDLHGDEWKKKWQDHEDYWEEKFAKLIEEYNQKFVKLEEEKNYFWESFLVIQDKLENFRKIKLEALAFLVGKPKKRRSSAPVPKATKFFSQPMRKSASATTTPLPSIKEEYFVTNWQSRAKNISTSEKETSPFNKLTWKFPPLPITLSFCLTIFLLLILHASKKKKKKKKKKTGREEYRN